MTGRLLTVDPIRQIILPALAGCGHVRSGCGTESLERNDFRFRVD